MNISFNEAWRQRALEVGFSILLLAIIAYTAIALNFDQPFLSYAFACGFVFLISARISLAYWLIAIVAAAGLAALHLQFSLDLNSTPDSISLYLGMLGRGSLLALGLAAIWSKYEDRRRLYQVWLLPVAIIAFVLLSTILLNFTIWIKSPVLDSYLYVFDGSLGFQPSFLIARVFWGHKVVDEIGRQIYRGLPLAIAIACAAHIKTHSQWRQLAILGTAGLIGYLLYFIFPATGPLYLAGPEFWDFPERFIPLRGMTPHLVEPILPGPRNAIPSLHMAWAILLCFGARSFSKAVQAGLALFAVATGIAALGLGEHYLIDLVIAFPFAVAVEAMWTPTCSRKTLTVGLGLTVAWLILIRYGSELVTISLAIPWTCIVASTMISLTLYTRDLLPSRRGHEAI